MFSSLSPFPPLKTFSVSPVFSLILLSATSGLSQYGEDTYNAAMGASVGGRTEVRHLDLPDRKEFCMGRL